ncbi:hypothetical protein D3C78_1140910 [compost metagenome]
MQSNQNIRIDLPNGFASLIEQLAHLRPIRFTNELSIRFIAYLNHANINTCINQGLQAYFGIFVKCGLLIFETQIGPCLRRMLFGRIGPKVGIMKIH